MFTLVMGTLVILVIFDLFVLIYYVIILGSNRENPLELAANVYIYITHVSMKC